MKTATLHPLGEILVLDDNGDNLGKMDFRQAQGLAESRGLDLVQLDEHGSTRVFKIMDKGKWEYEKKKKSKNNNHIKHPQPKEMRFRLSTDERDISIKLKKVCQFLKEGSTVRLSIKMRGREKSHSDMAVEKINSIISLIPGEVHSSPVQRSDKIVSTTIRSTNGLK
jgi:translation initiation factor IF-3